MIHKEARSRRFLYPHPLPSNEKLSPRKKKTGAEVSPLRKHLRNKEETFVLPVNVLANEHSPALLPRQKSIPDFLQCYNQTTLCRVPASGQ